MPSQLCPDWHSSLVGTGKCLLCVCVFNGENFPSFPRPLLQSLLLKADFIFESAGGAVPVQIQQKRHISFSIQDIVLYSECSASFEKDCQSILLIHIVCGFQCQIIENLFGSSPVTSLYVCKGGRSGKSDFFPIPQKMRCLRFGICSVVSKY